MGKISIYYDASGMLLSGGFQPDIAEISDPRLIEMINSGSGIAYLVDYVSRNLGWRVVSYPSNVGNCFVVFDNQITDCLHQTLCVKVEICRNGRLKFICAISLDHDPKLLPLDSKFESLQDLNTFLTKRGWCLKNTLTGKREYGPIRLWYAKPLNGANWAAKKNVVITSQ